MEITKERGNDKMKEETITGSLVKSRKLYDILNVNISEIKERGRTILYSRYSRLKKKTNDYMSVKTILYRINKNFQWGDTI